jgi:hypothetical protein
MWKWLGFGGVSLGAHVGLATPFVVLALVARFCSAPAPTALNGETVDVEAMEVSQPAALAGDDVAPPPPLAPSAGEHSDDVVEELGDLPAKKVHAPRRPSKAQSAPSASVAAAPSASPGSAGGGLFGAVGEPGAVDLATAFVRAFPQAASTDPIWAKAAFGAAGSMDVLLTLDESGRITGEELRGGGAELRAGASRSLALIRNRKFTAKGAHTRLRLTATVSHDEIHDGLHGDVFAIGGSFAGRTGNAFFALAIGRRIDLSVTTP